MGSMPTASMASMTCCTRSTLGQPEMRRRMSPPGRTNGSVENASRGPTARTMSMREMTVPKSFDAQRTKAKTLPGAKLTTRR